MHCSQPNRSVETESAEMVYPAGRSSVALAERDCRPNRETILCSKFCSSTPRPAVASKRLNGNTRCVTPESVSAMISSVIFEFWQDMLRKSAPAYCRKTILAEQFPPPAAAYWHGPRLVGRIGYAPGTRPA